MNKDWMNYLPVCDFLMIIDDFKIITNVFFILLCIHIERKMEEVSNSKKYRVKGLRPIRPWGSIIGKSSQPKLSCVASVDFPLKDIIKRTKTTTQSSHSIHTAQPFLNLLFEQRKACRDNEYPQGRSK